MAESASRRLKFEVIDAMDQAGVDHIMANYVDGSVDHLPNGDVVYTRIFVPDDGPLLHLEILTLSDPDLIIEFLGHLL